MTTEIVLYCCYNKLPKFGTLKQYPLIILQFWEQKFKMCLAELKSRCQQAIFLSINFTFLTSRDCTHSLASVVIPSSRPAMASPVFLTLVLSDSNLPAAFSHFEGLCDYIMPIQIIQDNHSLQYHLINNLSPPVTYSPLPCNIAHSQIPEIRTGTSSRAIACLLHLLFHCLWPRVSVKKNLSLMLWSRNSDF